MSIALRSYHLAALNNAWANRTLHAALAHLSPAEFTAPRPGFFGTLAATLNHIHVVDLYYLDALECGGQGRAVFDRAEIAEPQRLFEQQAGADARLIAFCERLTEDTLAETRQTERRDGPMRERVADLLPHLFQHQIHHRGQAHVQVGVAGIAPPQLDDFYLACDRAPSAAALRPDHGAYNVDM